MSEEYLSDMHEVFSLLDENLANFSRIVFDEVAILCQNSFDINIYGKKEKLRFLACVQKITDLELPEKDKFTEEKFDDIDYITINNNVIQNPKKGLNKGKDKNPYLHIYFFLYI